MIDCASTESILTKAAYLSSRYVLIPVRPEFLATVGLPLLARSLDEFDVMNKDQLQMAGVLFTYGGRSGPSKEQKASCRDVTALATKHDWPVFDNKIYRSDLNQPT